jgi:hypothetical protein
LRENVRPKICIEAAEIPDLWPEAAIEIPTCDLWVNAIDIFCKQSNSFNCGIKYTYPLFYHKSESIMEIINFILK